MTTGGRPPWGPRGGLTTAGTGRVRVVPDLAVVELAAQASDEDPAAALAAASTCAGAVVAALRAAGVAEADVRTSATSSWTDPGTTVHEPDGEHVRPARTTVRIALEATVSAAGSGELVAGALAAAGGGATLDRTVFAVSDDGPARRRARELAFADAVATAQQLASLAGRPLGRVVDVREEPEPGSGPGPMALAAKAGGLPLEPGGRDVVVGVRVRHAWGDGGDHTDDAGTPQDR